MKRFLLSFLLLALSATSMPVFAATTVTSDTIGNNLVNRFVQNAAAITVTATQPIVFGAANQIGLVTTTNLGNIQVNPLPAAATPVIIGTGNLTGSIILTTGNIGGTTNIGGTGSNIGSGGDANITAIAGVGTFDAASLQFDFTVTGNPLPTAITFELVFASNETIAAINPDTAIVLVDGVNYAKLNNGGLLSNQTAGILVAATPGIVTGFANVSQTQTVTAVLAAGVTTHRIKIAIADSIDRLRDSAVIVANLRAITSPQGGMGVGDILAPVITLDPAIGTAITKEATAPLTPVNLGAVTVTDNFSPPNALPQATPTPAGPYAVGVTAVTWSATDAAGNIGTATQTITVNDTTPPVVTAPINKTFSTTDPNMAVAITTYLNTVTATDVVGVAGAITNNAPIGGFPLGATTVTFTASDAALNAGTATSIITVVSTSITATTIATALANQLNQDPNITIINPITTAVGANQSGIVNSTNLGVLIPAAPPLAAVALSLPKRGIMLTTGNTTGTGNNLNAPNAAIGADADVSTALIANAAFNTTGTFDASSLQFSFTVVGNPTSINFDFIYATNEAIGGAGFPDAAVVMVDGVNRAVFNNGLLLSNLNGAFLTATNGTLVPGFTNVSRIQHLTATLNPALTTHSIKITIADNNDGLVDSALIISNMVASNSTQNGMGVGDILPPIITLNPPVAILDPKFPNTQNVAIEANAPLSNINLGAPTVTDNIDVGLRATAVPAGPYAVGARLVTWTAIDAAGNVGTVTQTVTVNDTTPPVVTAPINKTFSTTDPNMAVAITTYLNTVTATDVVGVVGAITNNAPAAGFPLGATTITFTATDAALNAGTATTIITIVAASITTTTIATTLANQLNQDPNITIITPTTTAVGTKQSGIINSTNLGVLIPAAPLAVPPLAAVALLLPKQGVMLSTGNTTGTGNNLNAPNAAIGADADVSTALIANAAFNTTGTFDASSLQFSFTVVGNPTAINFDFIYATNEAIGGAGFPDAAVIMVDGVNRAVFNNGLLLSNLNGAFLTATNGTLVPGFTNVSRIQHLTATLNPALTTHSIKITIADNNDGLVDSALIISNMVASNSTQNGMGVGDILPPIITLNPPAAILDPKFPNTQNVAIEANAPLSNINLGAPTVTDNIDVGLRATAVPAGPYAVGARLVTWTATDAAGNVGTATQTVTVNDTTPPIITAPIAKTFLRTSPTLNADITAYLATATAIDLVAVVLPITNNAPVAGFPAGATTVTITALDAAGNIATATTIISISGDIIPPVLTPPAAANFIASSPAGLAASNGALAAYLASASATDAGGIRSITNNAPATFPIGVTTVSYTATDNFGNTSTASSNITITAFIATGAQPPVANGFDQIPPIIKLVGSKNMKVLQTAVGVVALFADPGATVIDNFDGATPGTIPATTSIDTSIVGRTLLTYRATDQAGNTASIIRTVDVVTPIAGVDLLPPTVTAPVDILVASTSFAGIAKGDPSLNAFFGTFAAPTVTAVDNVAVAGAISNNAPATIPVGKTIVTFTAKDIQGNTGTADAVITVTGIAQNPGTATDFDADGIPDAWEMQVFGNLITAAAATDFDLDGITDAMERILGTNPKAINTNASGASTDLKDAIFLNNPSDSDHDGISDILEDNASVLDASVVTGIPAATGATTFTIRGNGSPIQSVAVNQIGSAPVNVISSYGVLSYNVLTSIGGTATIQINSSKPFGVNAQYYKVDAAGNYSLIPATHITQVGANTINLKLTDGGAFDLDGIANGVIIDPIAFGAAPQVLGANGGIGGGKGGCSLSSDNTIDPLLPSLLVFSAYYLFMRRKQTLQHHDHTKRAL